jgi:hypothetical protein
LNLAHNTIGNVEGLRCDKLRKLNLSSNSCSYMPDLSHFPMLEEAKISHNYISTLQGIGSLLPKSLHTLDLGSNEIGSIIELTQFSETTQIRNLVLISNKFQNELSDYRSYVAYLLPDLLTLDREGLNHKDMYVIIIDHLYSNSNNLAIIER